MLTYRTLGVGSSPRRETIEGVRVSVAFNDPVGPRRLVCRESSLGFSVSYSYHSRVYIPYTNSKSSANTLLRLCVLFQIVLLDAYSILSLQVITISLVGVLNLC